jgi:hypothetical protein
MPNGHRDAATARTSAAPKRTRDFEVLSPGVTEWATRRRRAERADAENSVTSARASRCADADRPNGWAPRLSVWVPSVTVSAAYNSTEIHPTLHARSANNASLPIPSVFAYLP